MMVAGHRVREYLCTCGLVPRCTRSVVPLMLLPYLMTCMKVFCTMECAPSQCTVNVYWVIMCFENLNHFFKLELTAWEFFYFFKVRRYKKYAQAHVCKAKLFDSLN
ncbi:unnamed protein product [Prunus armeniaca]